MKKIVIPFLLLVIIALTGTTVYFYGLFKEARSVLIEDYYANLTLIDGQQIHKEIFLMEEGRWWISADAVISYIDSEIYYSGSGKRIYLPSGTTGLKLENRELTNYFRTYSDSLNLPVRKIDGKRFIEMTLLEDLYPVAHHYYEPLGVHALFGTGDDNFRARAAEAEDIMSLGEGMAFEVGDVKAGEDVPVSSLGKGISFKVGTLKVGEKVTVMGQDSEKALVLTSRGEYGVVPVKAIGRVEAVSIVNEPVRGPRSRSLEDGKVRLVWEQIHAYEHFSGDMAYGPQDGLDVISPTFFSLNVDGIVLNIADRAYIEAAHEKGLKIWALFSNSFDPDWTHQMLSDEVLRRRTVAQVIAYAAIYDLDGINVDFENVYLKDKDLFTEFVAELAQMLHQQGMTVSVDVTVPWGSDMWSRFADRTALAEVVDYVMLMAYDEHWGSSQKAGSVASSPWVEKGIEESLKLIPKEKLILGIPFYSRVWTQIGNGKMSSKSIGFNGQKRWLEENGASGAYDPDTGQNYAEIKQDGTHKRIWLEDATSLSMRLDLAKKHDLAGIAGWSLLFTTEDVWRQIESEYPK